MSEKLYSPKARASYAFVFEPHKVNEDSEPKYSLTLIIPKEEKEGLQKLKKAAREVAVAKFGEAAASSKKFKWPFKDGDQEDDEAYAGSIFIRTSSKRKPQVVDKNLNPIMDMEEFYSGCYCIATLRPYTYDHPTGGKGVSFGLGNVMKLAEGDRLSGGSSAEDDFKGMAAPSDASDEDIDDII